MLFDCKITTFHESRQIIEEKVLPLHPQSEKVTYETRVSISHNANLQCQQIPC